MFGAGGRCSPGAKFQCPGEGVLAWFKRHSSGCWLSLGFALVACALLIIVNDTRDGVSPFIYFNF